MICENCGHNKEQHNKGGECLACYLPGIRCSCNKFIKGDE